MRREHTARIISIIVNQFPQQYSNIDDKSLDLLIEEWNLQFMNESYENVYAALQYHISTSVFSPTIAGIKNLLFENSGCRLPSGEEAWSVLLKAGRCFRPDAMEEYQKLPSFLKDVVTAETLYEIGNASNESILYIKNGFLKDYQSKRESHKREYLISSISNDIKKLGHDEEEGSILQIGSEDE